MIGWLFEEGIVKKDKVHPFFLFLYFSPTSAFLLGYLLGILKGKGKIKYNGSYEVSSLIIWD